VQYALSSRLSLSANVLNLFNRSPPYDNTYSGIDNQPYNIFNYNDYGRSFFVGANYALGQPR
jgi:iron complex outermembrane recepter protein